MQFTKLRLLGFKSFVEPQEFVIERGLTGVVGPNGCGKSNLVEALRWVMGENSYKNMRASGMDDVIFSGSNTRPARNSAEVTLFLNNQDRSAPQAFNDADELQVSRRIERESGSVYRINGKDVRAKDVQLLFADQSTGARSPSMVGQGRIGELIQAKPQARRALLEEAAGISGLHSRRHEAELRLRAAEGNLDRLEDVVGDLSGRMESLKRQARQANRFKSLSANIRELEAGLYYLRWAQAKTNEVEAETLLTKTTSDVAEKAQAHMLAEKQRDADRERLNPLREEAARAAATLQRLQLAGRQLEEEVERNRFRQNELLRRLEQLNADIERENSIVAENDGILARLDGEEESLKITLEESAAEETARTEQMEAVAERLRESEETLRIKTAEQMQVRAEISQIERSLVDIATRRAAQQSALDRVISEIEAINEEIEAQGDIDAMRQMRDSLQENMEALEASLQQCEHEFAHAREQEEVAREPLAEAEKNVGRLEAEAATIQNMLQAASSGDYAPVVDLLKVEKGFETALGAALGDGLEAAMEEAAAVFWKDYAVASSLPSFPDGVEVLADFVDAPHALQRALRMVGIVTQENGAKLQQTLKPGQILVSREGALWRWDGLTARADAPTAAAQRLAQKNRLGELEGRVEAALLVVAQSRKALEEAALTVRNVDQRQKQIREDIRQTVMRRDEIQRQLSDLEKRMGECLARRTALEQNRQRLVDELAQIDFQTALLQQKAADLTPSDSFDSQIAAMTAKVNEERVALADARAAVEGFRRELDVACQRLQMIARERSDWRGRAENARRQIVILDERREQALEESENLMSAPDDIEQRRIALFEEIAKAETIGHEIMDRLAKAENDQTGREKFVAEAFAQLSSAREERARAEERLNAAVDRCSDIEARISEHLNCAPVDVLQMANFPPDGDKPDIETLEHQIERVKLERERLGAVNLRAEEEEQELRQRYEAMTVERDDVVEAIKKLRQAIHNLNREGRERLLAAFEKVNQEFKRLFTHLFGGGEAELQLIESEDPLDAGLEILARPPGKKPQTMTLLSGGEQALTAMALIFAVFLTNPAPICVLDEVDAPLDDHNVERYCNLLDEMANSTLTRFVVITHNPITMARMSRLFGVTMGEQGVSQLVSVDLQTAEKLREAS